MGSSNPVSSITSAASSVAQTVSDTAKAAAKKQVGVMSAVDPTGLTAKAAAKAGLVDTPQADGSAVGATAAAATPAAVDAVDKRKRLSGGFGFGDAVLTGDTSLGVPSGRKTILGV